MRVKIGGCRMPIGMCSEYRDKDCGKFCYYNTVDIKTNADRIRAMTDEELARFIAGQRGWYCDFEDPTDEEYPKVLEWLKQEADE